MYTLQQSINWSQTFIEYQPLDAGTNFEPSLSVASMIRNTIMNAPFTWPWNRNEYLINSPNTPASLTANVQDYTLPITDFAYLEKVSLLTADGKFGYELKDIYNRNILGIPALQSTEAAQPNAASVRYYTPGTSIAVRFLPPPDQAYTGVLTYQKLPVPFQSFSMNQVQVISGVAFYFFTSPQAVAPAFAGQDIRVSGFDIAANNGTFVCASTTTTYMILVNPSAVNDTHAAFAVNIDWYPVPDSFMDVFNNLFLAEAFSSADDMREQTYRARGIAALLSKAEGLTEMQVNAFLSQYIARGTSQMLASQLRTQQGNQARGN